MNKKLAVAMASALMAASCFMGVTANAQETQRSITVSGESTVMAKPDVATVNISVETASPNAKAAARENANTMTAVKNAVVAAGANASAIETNNYNLYPEQVYEGGKAKTKDYKCENSMKVTVNNLALTGPVMDAAIKAGANRIDSVEFKISHPEQFKERALREATANAAEKARVIAAALGRNVVNVYSVTENSNDMVAYRMMNLKVAGAARDNAATPIEPGDAQVKSNVTVVFEIA
jgi:uncharacterized protein YggE